MIGEFLFGLQPQESVSAPVVQRVADRRLVSNNAQALGFDWQVPKDKALILQGVHISAATAGVTTVNSMDVLIADPEFNTLHVLGAETPIVVVQPQIIMGGMSDHVIVMPEEVIRWTAAFSAAAVGNILEASFIGLLIPKGTLQLGFATRL